MCSRIIPDVDAAEAATTARYNIYPKFKNRGVRYRQSIRKCGTQYYEQQSPEGFLAHE
jgi:hypothetical protein